MTFCIVYARRMTVMRLAVSVNGQGERDIVRQLFCRMHLAVSDVYALLGWLREPHSLQVVDAVVGLCQLRIILFCLTDGVGNGLPADSDEHSDVDSRDVGIVDDAQTAAQTLGVGACQSIICCVGNGSVMCPVQNACRVHSRYLCPMRLGASYADGVAHVAVEDVHDSWLFALCGEVPNVSSLFESGHCAVFCFKKFARNAFHDGVAQHAVCSCVSWHVFLAGTLRVVYEHPAFTFG